MYRTSQKNIQIFVKVNFYNFSDYATIENIGVIARMHIKIYFQK